jgi:FkbM family methyltransferase
MKNFIRRANSFLQYEGKEFIWSIQKKFRKTLIVKTNQGSYRIFTNDNAICRSLFVRKEYESELITKTISFLREINKVDLQGKGIMLDIGANNGITSITMLLRKYFSNSIAIEPEPNNFNILKENLKLNNLLDSVYCFQNAVSDSSKELNFELSNNNFGDHRIRNENQSFTSVENFAESKRKLTKVQALPLPEILKQLPEVITNKIEIVWIDIQGHEGFLFRGAKDWFINHDVPVVAEIWPYVILRSGMSIEEFDGIVKSIWNYYYVIRRGRFIRYPIQTFSCFLNELRINGSENIILMKD